MKSYDDTFSISNSTRGRLPSLPLQHMKEAVLGKKYELSVAFVTSKESQTINFKTRNHDKPTNILSFPFSDTSGEIVICPAIARLEAPRFDRSYKNFLGFLFIHGLVHLKGFTHGSRMEAEERKCRAMFSL